MIGLLALVAATGQAPQATRTPPEGYVARSPAEAAQTLHHVADCLVGDPTKRAWVDAYLRRAPDARDMEPFFARFRLEACMPRSFVRTRLTFPPPLLRGALYEAIYTRRFKSAGVDLSQRPVSDFAAEVDGGAPPELWLHWRQMGDCVVRATPDGTRALLFAKAASESETAAFTQLMPTVASCIPSGRRVGFSRPMLRGIVAEALYKLSVAPPATAPSSSND